MTEPRRFHVDDTLRDGTAITFRAVRPDDKARIARAFAGLERESVYTRFFTFKERLGDDELAHLDHIDFVHEAVLVATRAAAGDEEVIASARYIEHPTADGVRTAEVAFTVEEDYRGQGLAHRLLTHLATLARAQGIARFDADVLADNGSMLAVFARCGFPVTRRRDGGALHVTLDLLHPA